MTVAAGFLFSVAKISKVPAAPRRPQTTCLSLLLLQGQTVLSPPHSNHPRLFLNADTFSVRLSQTQAAVQHTWHQKMLNASSICRKQPFRRKIDEQMRKMRCNRNRCSSKSHFTVGHYTRRGKDSGIFKEVKKHNKMMQMDFSDLPQATFGD